MGWGEGMGERMVGDGKGLFNAVEYKDKVRVE